MWIATNRNSLHETNKYAKIEKYISKWSLELNLTNSTIFLWNHLNKNIIHDAKNAQKIKEWYLLLYEVLDTRF